MKLEIRSRAEAQKRQACQPRPNIER
jgi:hypothetical protein